MSAQTGTKHSKRFLASKLGLKKMVEEALTEQRSDDTEEVEIKKYMSNLPLAAIHDETLAGCNIGPSINEDLDGSMYAMDFGTRFPEPLSAKEIMDDAAAQELEERFHEAQFADEFDEIDFELAMHDFTTAAINAAKEDPQAATQIKNIFEHHISPEARAICDQVDANNPTIKTDRFLHDAVIGDAAEHAIENSGEYDHLR